MPAPTRRERHAHRPRWRPAPTALNRPSSGSRTALAPGRQAQRQGPFPPASKPEPNTSITGLDLPQLFAPAQAAEILRRLGLTELTECALRTRAYRRQVPFHLNGRRIRFTASDLREIVEGQSRRPKSIDVTASLPPGGRRTPRRSPTRTTDHPPQTWRARRPRDSSGTSGEQSR
jgi:hypothetical protein